MRACPVHDNLVESVQSHHCEVVAALDEIGVDFNLTDGALLHLDLHHLFEELDVDLLLGGSDVRAEEMLAGVVAQASYESFQHADERLNLLDDAVAEAEGLHAVESNVLLFDCSWHVEGQSVSLESTEILLEVNEFSGAKHDIVVACL